jgi:hypothetical protein
MSGSQPYQPCPPQQVTAPPDRAFPLIAFAPGRPHTASTRAQVEGLARGLPSGWSECRAEYAAAPAPAAAGGGVERYAGGLERGCSGSDVGASWRLG